MMKGGDRQQQHRDKRRAAHSGRSIWPSRGLGTPATSARYTRFVRRAANCLISLTWLAGRFEQTCSTPHVAPQQQHHDKRR